MSEEKTTRAVLTTDGRVLIEQPDGSYRPAESQTDWQRLDAMSEDEIEQNAAKEMAALGIDYDWASRARIVYPSTKERITIRLDPDILNWFKAQGKGYQSRMQAVLRAYVETHKHPSR
jgi:uncharacterized protein (DUF4415 family)